MENVQNLLQEELHEVRFVALVILIYKFKKQHFAQSCDLWENRISIVSSWAFVKKYKLDLTLELCKHFMNHRHHLIHKACGWMLHEVGKKNEVLLIDFLKEYKDGLPKTTISYAKERIRKCS